jgi:hypothetical protein
MSDFSNVCGSGEIAALQYPFHGLSEHFGFDRSIRSQWNIWRQRRDNGFPTVFPFFVDQDVDQFRRSLKGFEDSLCPFVVALGIRDERQRLGIGVLKPGSEFLC